MAVYNQDIKNVYEKISGREQKQLLELARAGDSEARDKLINSCLPMLSILQRNFLITISTLILKTIYKKEI